MTDKLKRYVLPNLPYLFVLWFFLKLGTAYRLAAGADFVHKLIGTFQTIGPAFGTIAPGLNGFDWLIGLVGAAAVRLLVCCKVKNAKKFRRDAEYGSARWGTAKDIKPFVDPVFQNNVILTGTEFLTMNTRPKNPANARNLNCCVIGSSGSGKTRFWLTPQLLQAHSSYVTVDSKGGILGQVGAFLTRQGYTIKVFNSIDFSKSMHYNPLAYVRTENDILKFVNALITNTRGDGKEGDEFWTKAEVLLYQNGSTGKVTVSGVWAFHGGRQPGETSSTSNGGNRGNHYNNRLYWYEGYSIDILQMDGSQYTPQYNGKTYFYCIHKWVNYGTGNRKFYVDSSGNGDLTNSPYWKNGLNQTQRDLLKLVSMYGFPARTPQQLGVSTVDDA